MYYLQLEIQVDILQGDTSEKESYTSRIKNPFNYGISIEIKKRTNVHLQMTLHVIYCNSGHTHYP